MRLVTPQPGYALSDVTNLLKSGQFIYVEIFTIAPLQGPVMRFTNVQEDVTVVAWNDTNRYTYKARDVILGGLIARSSIGPSVDEQEIEISYSATSQFQASMPWAQALLQGRLDGATISRDRALASTFGSPWIGVTRMFSGVVSTLDSVGRMSAKIKVKSALERLDHGMPRELYTPHCKNVWGDAKCGVNQAAFAVLGTIGAGATNSMIPWTGAGANFVGGKIHITNGDSVTRARSIIRATSSALYLTYPLDFVPAATFQFTAYPGCAHTMTACQVFHPTNWQQYFGGFPFIPVAETAL